jgi:hypothetical protein
MSVLGAQLVLAAFVWYLCCFVWVWWRSAFRRVRLCESMYAALGGWLGGCIIALVVYVVCEALTTLVWGV